jgi:TetR/AcrR family transcriptional regulator
MVEEPKTPLDKDRLHRILEVAQKRFAHYGVGKTTMTEIASDLGMSKASIYYYYPDKEHLFLAVIQKEMDEFIAGVIRVTKEKGTASKKLKHYVSIRQSHFQRLVSLAHIDEQSLTIVKSSSEKLHEHLVLKETKLVQHILSMGIKAGEFTSFATQTYADLLVTSMRGLRVLMIHKKELIDPEDYAKAEHYQKQLTTLFLKAITKS